MSFLSQNHIGINSNSNIEINTFWNKLKDCYQNRIDTIDTTHDTTHDQYLHEEKKTLVKFIIQWNGYFL